MIDLINAFKQILTEQSQILLNEPMSEHTTFRTGGPADIFLTPYDAGQLNELVKICMNSGTKFFILGNGSNVLFKDNGFRGAVISTKAIKTLELAGEDDQTIKAGAGVLLKDLSGFAYKNGLTGLEFACGIPGSTGGAVYMNAGAYDSEIKNVFYSAQLIDAKGKNFVLTKDEMNFGYRSCCAQKEDFIITEALFKLEKGLSSDIKDKIDDFTKKREDKQPLSEHSAGSTFKRPDGYFAGKLIMDSGLKGYKFGGAAVSDKHCGFVVNKGSATSSDILSVIEYVIDVVYKKFGVTLEPEVKIVGE